MIISPYPFSPIHSLPLLTYLVFGTACTEVNAPPDQILTDPPLVKLAEAGDLPAIDGLLSAGVAPDASDSCHWTPLMKAALKGHVATAQRLLSAGANPDAEDKGGYRPLMLAASQGHDAVLSLLVAHGANLDHQEYSGGWTALIWAAKEGHLSTLAILLARGANPSLTGLDGRSAADWARARGDEAILALLTGQTH